MNILYLTSVDPRKTDYGGQQRSHAIWEGLKTIGNVCVVRPVPSLKHEDWDESSGVYYICFDKRYSLSWFIRRMWGMFFPELTIGCGISLSPLKKLCRNFDLVVVQTLKVVGYLRPWRIATMYVDIDDTPTTDYALAHPKRLLRLFLLRKWQEAMSKKAELLWVPDSRQINDFTNRRVCLLPNIPSQMHNISENESLGDRLLFVGYLSHPPNQVALDWFLHNFWEKVNARFRSLKFSIVGGGLPERYKIEWGKYPNVELLGFVDDLEQVYKEARVMIAPMRTGSGTCIKVLESLAHGVPVIATAQGLRGIDEANRTVVNGIYQFDDEVTLIEALLNVLALSKPSRGAMQFIRTNYSQAMVGNALLHSIKNNDVACR